MTHFYGNNLLGYLLLHHCNEIHDISHLREELFVLAHGFRWLSPWLLGPLGLGRTGWQMKNMAEELLYLIVGRRQITS
jgi:hypothetical protein